MKAFEKASAWHNELAQEFIWTQVPNEKMDLKML